MPKPTPMQIANAVADAVSKAQDKKKKPKKAQALEEPSLNDGKSGSEMSNPDDAQSESGSPITGLSKPMPNKTKKQHSGTVKHAK